MQSERPSTSAKQMWLNFRWNCRQQRLAIQGNVKALSRKSWVRYGGVEVGGDYAVSRSMNLSASVWKNILFYHNFLNVTNLSTLHYHPFPIFLISHSESDGVRFLSLNFPLEWAMKISRHTFSGNFWEEVKIATEKKWYRTFYTSYFEIDIVGNVFGIIFCITYIFSSTSTPCLRIHILRRDSVSLWLSRSAKGGQAHPEVMSGGQTSKRSG